MPRETITCLLNLELPVQFIQGYGDREVLARMRGVETGALPESVQEILRWVSQQLPPSRFAGSVKRYFAMPRREATLRSSPV